MGNESASGPRSAVVGRNDGVISTGDHAQITQVRAIPFSPPSQVSPGQRILGLPRPPTPVFVGREAAYDRLTETLSAQPEVVVTQALYGLGGVGKSELALQYAHRQHERYPVVWWITADTPEHLQTGLAGLAQRLLPGAANAGTTEDAAAWTIEWLRANPGWLLVLDNVTDPTHIDRLLGSVEGGHILITSRRDVRWPGTTTTLPLEVLTLESAAELVIEITGRSKPEDRTAAEEIAAELGFLPLALDQAAAYIRQTRIAPARYLRRLREQPARLYETAAHGDKAQATIARLWDITIDALAETAPSAITLLKILACYAPDDIPRFMLGGEELTAEIDNDFGVLASHSMIALTDEAVSLHRLTQAVLLSSTASDPDDDSGDRTSETALMWLLRAMPADPDTQVSGWPTWRVLAPHVDAITGRILPARLRRAVGVALNQTGLFLHTQGEYQRANAILTTATAITETALGPDHPDMAIRLGNLAAAYSDLDQAADALSAAKRAEECALNSLGAGHPVTETLRESLANLRDRYGVPG